MILPTILDYKFIKAVPLESKIIFGFFFCIFLTLLFELE